MVVSDLVAELEKLPPDAWVDAMFPVGVEAYAVTGVSSVALKDGRVIAVVEITDGPALSVA